MLKTFDLSEIEEMTFKASWREPVSLADCVQVLQYPFESGYLAGLAYM